MDDDNWDDEAAPVSTPTNNTLGFGVPGGRGFKADDSNGDRKPGGGFGSQNGDNGGGGGRGFGNRNNENGESRGFGGGGGGRGGGNRGFGRDENGGSKGFGGDDNAGSRGFGGGGSRGFGGGGGGGGGFNRRNEDGGGDDDGSNNRGFGGRGRGRGGGGGFNRRNNDEGDGESGGSRGFGGGGGGGSRGFGGGGGGGFNRRNNDEGEGESGGSRGFGGGGGGGSRGFGGGGGGGFNRRNNDEGDEESGGSRGFGGGGGGGSRGFGGGGGKGFGGDNDDGGNRGFGGGGRGGRGGFNRRNDGDDGGDGGGRGFGGGGRQGFGGDNNDDGESRGFGGGGRGGRGGGRGGGRSFGGDREGGGEGGDGQEKPREIYVPKEHDEEEIFQEGTRAGINFSKYDSIEVKTSGEDVPNQINSFEDANLRTLLYENIKKSRYTTPTPVQKFSLPIVMSGRDMMACAQTGSGKTAAFVIPIVHKLLEKPREIEDMRAQNCVEPRALVLSPTRELAIQTYDAAKAFSLGSVLHCRIAYGGAAVGHQLKQLFNGCDILVATPGRLMQFVGMGKVSFSAIEFLVLDEADRMLDPNSISSIEQIIRHDTMTPVGERQTLMFSATFATAIQQLAGKYLHNYIFLAVGIVGGACTDIEQEFIEVSKREKREKLKELLEIEKNNNALNGIIVFVEQKHTADFLAALLSQLHYPSTSIHGDRFQREREEALADFKSGRKGILVASPVASRGLDIPCARYVINFDLPDKVDEYIHRIGRTGRVGNKGKAVSFYDPDFDSRIQKDLLRILSQAGQPIPDWLSSEGGSKSFGPASSFGGQDIRSFSDVQDSAAGAAQPVEQDEDWN